jgi:hypothetical protein
MSEDTLIVRSNNEPDDTEPEDWSIRGLERITVFLRRELREPDLTKTVVGEWARTGKIDVDRLGPREYITRASRLRASVGKRPPKEAA